MNRLVVILTVSSCVPEAPETPSFQQDVLPILAANCVRCHGFPTLGGAPSAFRLDTFADVTISDGEVRDQPICGGDPSDPAAQVVICGAARYAVLTAVRIKGEARPMPPRFSLDQLQIETLENWARTAERGEPRPTNQLPMIEIEDTTRVGALITVRTRVEDADRDLVAGTLRVRVGSVDRVLGPLRSGTVEVVWDSTGVADGQYRLFAALDDGADVHTIELGLLAVGGL